MLPIYLLQDSVLGVAVYEHLYNYGCSIGFTNTKYLIVIFTYIVSLFVTAIVLEETRIILLKKPLSLLENFLNKKVNIFS